MMAITRPEPAARLLARPVNWFRVATAPLTWALNRASNGIVRLFGVDPSGLEEKHTSEDVKGIIRHSARGGTLDPGEAIMLGGVFHLHEQEAREVMTPIPAVVTVNADETVEDALQRCVSSGHTRLVAIENDNPDRVRGVVHNNSLARLYMNAGADASIESAIREVPIVPETKPLDDLLAELQRQRSSIGVVVDEYGRTVGIVTVEDILEEVVGEIEDETDARSSTVRRLADGDWYVRGHVAIGDLADAGIELPVDSDAYNSVGGYVFSELGRLPKRGDRIQANGHEIRVESVRENRIVAVRIRPLTTEHPVVVPPSRQTSPTARSGYGVTEVRPAPGVPSPCDVDCEAHGQADTRCSPRRSPRRSASARRSAERSRRSSSPAGTTCPTRACPGPRSPTRPAARESLRPTWSGTSRARATTSRPSARLSTCRSPRLTSCRACPRRPCPRSAPGRE